MTEEPGGPRSSELKALLRLAAPLASAHAGNQLMAFVDTAILGRLGEVELAAAGLANGIFFTFGILGMGVMMALEPLVAQAVGAGDPLRARRLLWQGAWLALLVGAAVSVPLAFVPLLLRPAGIDDATAAATTEYLLLRIPGVVPALVYVALRSYLQAKNVTSPMIAAMVVGNVFNLGADLLLVFGGAALPAWTGPLRWVPAMGVGGAALATALCTGLQAVLLALAAAKLPLPPPPADLRRPVRQDLVRAVRVGAPIGLQLMAEVGVFALVGLLAGRLGPSALASHQIALTIASMSFTVALGFGAAGAVRVGHAVGARDVPGTRRAGVTALAAGGAWMGACALLLWAFPRPLARLLTDQPGVVTAAVPLLAVAAVFQISDGLQAVGAGVLRGAGDTRFPFLANVVGHYAVGLPVAVVLGYVLGHGVMGLWWGLCAGLTAVALGLTSRFLRISRLPIAPLEHM